jgi:cephalosporin-C deacetylase
VGEYVLGRCAVDLWHAASALIDVVGALPLYYIGESFGGGIGALAVPWDDRFVGATFIVPSFGQYDLRLQMPCEGSGERVREHVAAHPEAREVLRYFDASTAAGFMRVPVRAECALWDRYVPPPGQFAVANAVPAEVGVELDVQPAGHAEYPGRADTLDAAFAATRAHIDRCLLLSRRRTDRVDRDQGCHASV